MGPTDTSAVLEQEIVSDPPPPVLRPEIVVGAVLLADQEPLQLELNMVEATPTESRQFHEIVPSSPENEMGKDFNHPRSE